MDASCDGMRALPLTDWISLAEKELGQFAERKVTVVTVISRDSIDRSAGDEVNDYLQMQAFEPYRDAHRDINVDAFYAHEDSVVFMVIKAPGDDSLLRALTENDEQGNFFRKLELLEGRHHNLLQVAFTVSHLVAFVEPTTRLDMALVRSLKAVNKTRLAMRQRIAGVLTDNLLQSPETKTIAQDGRLTLPRILFGFHRNVIRSELGQNRRKDIYEKLENSLEEQIFNVLKNVKLINNGTSNSLGYVPSQDKSQYVHLILPTVAHADALADIFDMCLGEVPNTDEIEDRRAAGDSFSKFLYDNIRDVGRQKEKFPLPSFTVAVQTIKAVAAVLAVEESPPYVIDANKNTNKELRFMEHLTDSHIEDAVARYMSGMTRPSQNDFAYERGRPFSSNYEKPRKEISRNVYTKAEHDERFADAVAYLDSVLIGPRDEAMARLRAACDAKWQGGLQGCEQQSVTGSNCNMAMHPSVGDASVAESEWHLHNSGVTFISTCSCGRMQALRKDPFTIKEANYDFYHINPIFTCCVGLERHNFAVLEDDVEVSGLALEGDSDMWADEGNWPGPGREMNDIQVLLRNSSRGDIKRPAGGSISKKSADSQESDANSEIERNFDEEKFLSGLCDSTESLTASSPSADENEGENYKRVAHREKSYLDLDEKVAVKERSNIRLDSAIKFANRLKKLNANRVINYLPGVPHSVTPDSVPLFPSWTLTCIGPGSLYSHSIGLRDQPNFKIASEYLVPVDVHLEVDSYSWEQDMQCVQAMESVTYASRFQRKPKRPGMYDNERVKLFVGFDYECPRGHRFFVGGDGQPLLLPKHQVGRDAALRDVSENLLLSDLPLRRQCTCRKLPHQTAQLTKIHIVTPKAPVMVTLDPRVSLPNQEGYFTNGEGPLKLAWARYYILQMPFVYSGPSGIWVPPASHEPVGTLHGNAIRVSYLPMGGGQ